MKASSSFLQSLSLTPAHGFCGAAALLAIPAHIFGVYQVMKARKKYKVEFPALYADKSNKNAKIFNCIQRAHQSTLEQMSFHVLLCFLSSVYRPYVAAAAITVRSVGFFVYIHGYGTGDPKNRNRGAFGYVGFFAMVGLSLEVVYRMITDK